MTSPATSQVTDTPAPGSSDPAPTKNLHLSVTRTWGNRTLPVKSAAWRTLRAQVLQRDQRTCASCGYASAHPAGRGMQIDHSDGNASNNDPENLRIHCPACEAIRHCGLFGMKGMLVLGKSDMSQDEIVRTTRRMFEETGKVPRGKDVDPNIRRAEIGVVDLANRMIHGTEWDDLTEDERSFRGFFRPSAWRMFAITMHTPDEDNSPVDPTALDESDRRALQILETEQSLPWIFFSVQKHKTIPDFLAAWPPSTTSQKDVAWICVNNSRHHHDGNSDLPGLADAWDKLCAERTPTRDDLDTLAKRYSCVSGKWLCFAPPAEIDALWARIVRATHSGTLGFEAKVGPRNEELGDQVICVFTEDCLDIASVMKVRDGLRRLGVKQKIGYKPDVYTHCRVYRGNAWDIPPTRYHC